MWRRTPDIRGLDLLARLLLCHCLRRRKKEKKEKNSILLMITRVEEPDRSSVLSSHSHWWIQNTSAETAWLRNRRTCRAEAARQLLWQSRCWSRFLALLLIGMRLFIFHYSIGFKLWPVGQTTEHWGYLTSWKVYIYHESSALWGHLLCPFADLPNLSWCLLSTINKVGLVKTLLVWDVKSFQSKVFLSASLKRLFRLSAPPPPAPSMALHYFLLRAKEVMCIRCHQVK